MLSLFLLAAVQTVAPVVSTNWVFQARDKDPITDLQSAIASVRSTISDAKLTVQCDVVGEPIVSVLFIPQQFTGQSGSQRVIFRIDEQSPIELISDPIAKAKAITELNDVRMLAHAFATGKTVYVRAFDYNGQPVDGRFDIEGGETAIKAVFDACKTPYDTPPKKKRGK